jgi:hypothetical protein
MAKRIPPKPTHRKRSPFYWWRRFPTHQVLHHYRPLIERIQNGDFDYPEYFEQAEWEKQWCKEEIESKRHLFNDSQSFLEESRSIERRYRKRQNLLIKDGYENEEKRLKEIVKQFSITFGGSKDDVVAFMEKFDGTLEEMYYAYARIKGVKNVSLLETMPVKRRGRGRPRKNPLIQ